MKPALTEDLHMSDHYWLSEAQIERIKPYFPRPHGVPRVDDRRGQCQRDSA